MDESKIHKARTLIESMIIGSGAVVDVTDGNSRYVDCDVEDGQVKPWDDTDVSELKHIVEHLASSDTECYVITLGLNADGKMPRRRAWKVNNLKAVPLTAEQGMDAFSALHLQSSTIIFADAFAV